MFKWFWTILSLGDAEESQKVGLVYFWTVALRSINRPS